jgi:hypothetical protein
MRSVAGRRSRQAQRRRERQIRLVGATAIVASVLALSACTSGGDSTAKPPPTTSRYAPPTLAGDPLNLSSAGRAPCTQLLRADQLAQFHITTPGTQTAVASGPACRWQPDPNVLPIYQAAVDQHSGGLAALYKQRDRLPVFLPVHVSEYPAVHVAASQRALTQGQCTVRVGVASDTLLSVDVTERAPSLQSYRDPCPDADAFAAAIIANNEVQQP